MNTIIANSLFSFDSSLTLQDIDKNNSNHPEWVFAGVS